VKGRTLLVLACLGLAGWSTGGPSTLAALKDPDGGIKVGYERATARLGVFGPFQEARASVPVRLLVADPGDPAARVGAAWAQGASQVLGDVATVDSREAVPAGAYLVEVGYALGEHQFERESRVYEVRDGERCHIVKTDQGEKVQCQDVVDTAVDKGRNVRVVRGAKAEVTVRLRAPDGTTVAEDVFSVAYAGAECRDPVAAAATVARVVGAQAATRRPVSQEFYSSIARLGCDQR